MEDQKNSIDVGFRNLEGAVLAAPQHFARISAEEVVEGLRLHYEKQMELPIIEDSYRVEGDAPSLVYPKLSEAFIPQSYKVCWYRTKKIRLEREETWEGLERREHLNRFILEFLSSPYSVETPLLILGHPGSGKSVLTKALSAKLMSTLYTVVRVPLREVDVDLNVESQIEQAVFKATGNQIGTWATFSRQFRERPLFVILDGYDELLQASGKVYSGYLDGIRRFMERESTQMRPVRVAVTSRITLIDKAHISEGTTVIRLMDFDENQQDAWVEIWNDTNSVYFSASEPSLNPFKVPGRTSKDKGKVAALAKQPLLLLMLALYDSEDNGLDKSKSLDRTVLYNSLLRRFIRRERSRYVSDFLSLGQRDQNREIDNEIKRLGVAALGMYNRRKVHLLASELESDIDFFGLGRQGAIPEGKALSQADFLLGSFFFIHKARSGQRDEDVSESSVDTAYEFLHNTFGEFLAAEFIMRHLLQETLTLSGYRSNDNYAEFEKKVRHPDGLLPGWFASLIHTPLHSRPVVLEMLREWAGHQFQAKRMSRKRFLELFDEIYTGQMGQVLDSREWPNALSKIDATQGAEPTLMGRLAVYTMNLVVVRTVLAGGVFALDESLGELSKRDRGAGTRYWDKLVYLWRSWFSLDSLIGLSAVFQARRKGGRIFLESNLEFRAHSTDNRFETAMGVATTLADDFTAGVAGLLTMAEGDEELNGVEARLDQEGIATVPEVLLSRLRLWIARGSGSQADIEWMISWGFENLPRCGRVLLVCDFLDLVYAALANRYVGAQCFLQVVQEYLHPNFVRSFADRQPQIVLRMLRLALRFGGHHWGKEYGVSVFRSIHVEEGLEGIGSDSLIEWLVLAYNFGGSDFGVGLIKRSEELNAREIRYAFFRDHRLVMKFVRILHLERLRIDGYGQLVGEALADILTEILGERRLRSGQKMYLFELLDWVGSTGQVSLLDNVDYDVLVRVGRVWLEVVRYDPDSAISVARFFSLLGFEEICSFWESIEHRVDLSKFARDLSQCPGAGVKLALLLVESGVALGDWKRAFLDPFLDSFDRNVVARLDVPSLEMLWRLAELVGNSLVLDEIKMLSEQSTFFSNAAAGMP